jgi:hypothetical protein
MIQQYSSKPGPHVLNSETRKEPHNMIRRVTLIGLVLGIELLLGPAASAQGTTVISNLEQPTVGSGAVGNDSWLAQDFRTGTNSAGYALNSVQLLMGAALGSPGGFSISIYSSLVPGSGAPGVELGSLSGADPTAWGIFSYAASGLTLSPKTFYCIVVTAGIPLAQGAYEWSAADSLGIIVAPGDPWEIDDAYFSSADGSSWTTHARGNIFQFAIDAAQRPVPEPSPLVLVALGLVVLLFHWRRS